MRKMNCYKEWFLAYRPIPNFKRKAFVPTVHLFLANLSNFLEAIRGRSSTTAHYTVMILNL